MHEKYYVFSDESGSWSDFSTSFYVRSWVKFKISDYEKLSAGKFQCIESLLKHSKEPFEIFFTFTILKEFQERYLKIRSSVNTDIGNIIRIFQQRGNYKEYYSKIPKKVIGAVNLILFLHIYERFHLIDALERLCSDIGKNDEVFFVIEEPQYPKKDYKDIFDSSKIKWRGNLNLIIFEKNKPSHISYIFGNWIANSLASRFRNLLIQFDTNKAKFFRDFVRPKLIKTGNITNGIDKVFYNPPEKSAIIKNLKEIFKTN